MRKSLGKIKDFDHAEMRRFRFESKQELMDYRVDRISSEVQGLSEAMLWLIAKTYPTEHAIVYAKVYVRSKKIKAKISEYIREQYPQADRRDVGSAVQQELQRIQRIIADAVYTLHRSSDPESHIDYYLDNWTPTLQLENGYFNRNCILRELGFDSYKQYLSSKLWSDIRTRILKRDSYTCAICESEASQVHHKRYELEVMLGERDEDLVSLCGSCHNNIEFGGKCKDKKRSFTQAAKICDRYLTRSNRKTDRAEKEIRKKRKKKRRR